MKRTATAVWVGSLKEGNGSLTTPGGILRSTQYTFSSRFESGPGLSPDELLAAAHAGCFAMTLCGALTDAGFAPDRLEVIAEMGMESTPPGGWTIATSHLMVIARVLGIEAPQFAAIAENVRAECPVSRALRAAITLDAKLQ